MTSPFWQEVEARYRSRLAHEVASGLDPVELRARPRKAPSRTTAGSSGTTGKRTGNFWGRPPTFNRTEMARLHEAGMRPDEIAARLGCTTETAREGLRAQGITPRDSRIGAPPREWCLAGEHRLEGENVTVHHGVRTCAPCKRRRDRETWRRRQVRRSLVEHGPPTLLELTVAGDWHVYWGMVGRRPKSADPAVN